MEPEYVLILDFYVGCLNITKLADEELRESENYEDFESFLSTIEKKYGFELNSCQQMAIGNLDIYCCRNEEEIGLNLLQSNQEEKLRQYLVPFFSFFRLVGDKGMEHEWSVVHNWKMK